MRLGEAGQRKRQSARFVSYDPRDDAPKFSLTAVQEVVKEAEREAFAAGQAAMLDGLAAVPLTIEGRWKPDTIYAAQSLVYHKSQQWIAKAQTASEPSDANALWRRVDFPGIATPATNEEQGDNAKSD